MDKIKETINAYKKKRWVQVTSAMLVVLLVFITYLFTGDNKEKLVANAMNMVSEKSSKIIDSHEYREVPWKVFLTEEDVKELNKESIPVLPAINFSELNTKEVLDKFEGIIDETEKLLIERDNFAQALDNIEVIQGPLEKMYQNEESGTFYMDILKKMYREKHVYPEEMNIVSIRQKLTGEESYDWIINVEWRALQDSESYLVYPITLTFDENYRYKNGKLSETEETKTGRRPVTRDAIVNENSHQLFIDDYMVFLDDFNKKEETGKIDDSHLSSIASEEIPLELLEEMFEASRGDLSNGSITSWTMNDKDAKAMTYYTLEIPTDNKGGKLKVKIAYSRVQNEIRGMKGIN